MIGTLLGNRYELIEKIGEGGMAEVYRAKCHLLNRYVSLKILKEEYSNDKEFVEKFKREASSAASLSDNNIVNIYDVGSEGNINYIVMEYVRGKTLKEIINQEGKLSYNKAIDTAIQIAKALECAHKNNIIHRDIKPHNILVTEEGIVKVTDFGIAKAASSVTITNTSKVMGSAHYFSPEQAKGSFVDFRTDIYSLGIVLYEMVTGRVPFDAESPVSVALKHIQEPVVPPKQLNAQIPESLNKLILKSIEKEPIKRYQSIKDMIFDLEKVKTNSNCNIVVNNYDNDYTRVMDPVLADDENYDEPKKKIVDTKTKKIIIGSLIVLLVVFLGGIGGWFYSNSGKAPKSSSSKEVEIPTISGKSKEEARRLVEAAGLRFTEAEIRKSDKPAGVVIEVFPTEGTKVKGNTEVRAVISAGLESTKVPNFKDMDLATAKIYINNLGLTLGETKEDFSDTVAKGYIISQTPEPDSNATKDTKINLVVSKGPEIRKTVVPNLIDLTLDRATTLITNAKLKLNTTITYFDTTDEALNNKVKAQSLAPESSVPENTVITLTVYRFKQPVKEQVTVPKFIGLTIQQARDEAAQANLKISFVDDKGVKITDFTGYTTVFEQKTAPGQKVDEGTEIILVLKKS